MTKIVYKQKKPIQRRGLPEKEGAWAVSRFREWGGEGLARKRGLVFLRGG